MAATMAATTGDLAGIDAELDRVARRLRLPYLRAVAPDVLTTAKAQRWAPAEIIKALLIAEENGRDHSTITNRRRKAHLPTGKTFDAWDPKLSSIPPPPKTGYAPWNGSPATRTSSCADPPGPENRCSSKPSVTP